MRRWLIGALAIGVVGCFGDLKFDENLPTSPGGQPPGSTTTLGSISAIIDNEAVSAPLQTPAIWRNGGFGFAAVNASGIERIISLSVRLSAAGTYAIGGPNFPSVSYMERDGLTTKRWTTTPRGAGSVTVAFLSEYNASGEFSVELLPDSATEAAGFTARRFMTNGIFNVGVSR